MDTREVLTPYEGKINALSGVVIDFKSPKTNMIKPADIAAALGKICRFGGQISHFYSVAQHSILVEHLAPHELKRAALLHDAAEAYCQDIISPLKFLLGEGYAKIEHGINKTVFEAFGEPIENLSLIKKYDFQAFQMERNAFKRGGIVEWTKFWRKEFGQESTIWPPDYAVKMYAQALLKRFPQVVKEVQHA